MSLLLDTHVLLWVLANDPVLAEPARRAIEDGSNRVLVSAVTAWEITIKKTLGKLRAPDDLVDQLVERRFTGLDVTIEHALAAGGLPGHHTDPFDRLLVAQARTERLTVVTRDPAIAAYDVETMAA